MEILDKLKITWCRDKTYSSKLSEFFLDNVGLNYKGLSDYEVGRVNKDGKFIETILNKITIDYDDCINEFYNPNHFTDIAIVLMDEELIAFTLIEHFHNNSSVIIHDFVISKNHRNQKIGQTFLWWLENEFKSRGVKNIFLENSMSNFNAHHFFNKYNYTPFSVVRCKKLD